MGVRVDFERFLDTATVDEYIKSETPSTSMEWLRAFWAGYLVDGSGREMPREEAERVIGGLTLKEFVALRREGELRDVAVPPTNGSD